MKDWTLDEKTRRSNSSAEYRAIVAHVDDLLRHSGFSLINGQHESVARLIVSQLAHGPYRMAPRRKPTSRDRYRGSSWRFGEKI